MNLPAEVDVGRGVRVEKGARLDRDGLVGGVTGARCGVVVRVAAVARGPAVDAGPGGDDARRVVASVARDTLLAGEGRWVIAIGVVRPIELEGDLAAGTVAVLEMRGVMD